MANHQHDFTVVNPNTLVRNRRSLDPTLITTLEIEELVGVSTRTVSRWRDDPTFPQPAITIARWNMPLHDRNEVIDWLVKNNRLFLDKR